MKKSKQIGILISVLMIAVVVVGFVSLIGEKQEETYAPLTYDESTCVHVKNSEIETSSIILGTHIIHLSAITEELYKIAEKSAEESGNDTMYYKSELADGTWFDISSAESINDISSGGVAVDVSVIEGLFFTHKTGSDKRTIDLRTNQAVSIFNINDPYDLKSMEELTELKTQTDVVVEKLNNKQGTDSDKITYNCLDWFYGSTILQTDDTTELDEQLAKLLEYSDVLKTNKAPQDQIDKVDSVMASIDASRRVLVFDIIDEALNTLTVSLNSGKVIVTVEDEEGDDVDTDVYSINSDVLSAAGSGQAAVGSSSTSYQAKIITEGTSVFSKEKFAYTEKLIEDAIAHKHNDCDKDVEMLLMLDHIEGNNVINASAELNYIKGTLVKKAETAYTNKLKAGINREYKTAVAQNESSARLKTICENAKNDADVARNELQFMIDAWTLRVSAEDGANVCNEKIPVAQGYKTTVPSDAFKEYMETSIDEYISYLTGKRDILLAAGKVSSELDDLIAEKEKCLEEMMDAFDKGDYEKGEELKKQAEEVGSKLDDLSSKLADEIAGLQEDINKLNNQLETASGDEKSELENELADKQRKLADAQTKANKSDVANQIAILRKQGLDAIDEHADTMKDEINGVLDALEGFLDTNMKLAYQAIKDIRDAMNRDKALNGGNGLDDALSKAESILENNLDAYNMALFGETKEDALLKLLKKLVPELNRQVGNDTSGTGSEDSSLGSGAGGSAGSEDSSLGSGAGGSAGSDGDGAGGGLLTAADLSEAAKALLKDIAEDNPKDLTEEMLFAVQIASLEGFADITGNEAGRNASLMLAEELLKKNGAVLIYDRVKDIQAEYVPVKNIADYYNYRYLWDNNGKTSTIAIGTTYYTFSLYNRNVVYGINARSQSIFSAKYNYNHSEYMSLPPQLGSEPNAKTLHIPESYAIESFNIEALYITKSDTLAIMLPKELKEIAEALTDLLLKSAE